MKTSAVRILIIGTVVALSGCATPLPVETRSSLKRVVVVNEFQKPPTYTHVGTTIFNISREETDDIGFKDIVADEVVTLLRRGGYAPEVVTKHPGDQPGVLIIRVVPRDIYNMIHTDGFGFYRQTFLAILSKQMSYAALNILPELNGKSRCFSCYGSSTTKLPGEKMPPHWSDLSEEQKDAFRKSLLGDVKNAVREAYEKTKL